MTRWINPVTVHFINPMRKSREETSVQFSERVKAAISDAAGLKNLSWDGYLKNYRPTRAKQDKMRLETRQEYLKELSLKLHTNRNLKENDAEEIDIDEARKRVASTPKPLATSKPKAPIIVPTAGWFEKIKDPYRD